MVLSRKSKRRIVLTCTYLIILIAIIIAVAPITFMIITSFKKMTDITNIEKLFNFEPTINNFLEILNIRTFGPEWQQRQVVRFNFVQFMSNSVTVAFINLAITLLVSFPAAYSIARWNTGNSKYFSLSFWILSIRMMPPVIFVIPLYILFRIFGILDTPWALILVYFTFTIPLATWVLYSFIKELPFELEEAARVDGYSWFEIMTKITLPLTAPGIVAVAVLCFIQVWNEFLFALILSYTKATTFTVGTALFMTAYNFEWTRISAACTIGMIPMIIFAFFVQKFLVRGLTLGAVK